MRRIRKIKITNILQLSPNMKRITFASNDLNDFPENENGGYVKNESSNTRVSIDFKALKYKNYDSSLLSDTIMVKKRGKWMPQKDVFNTEYYYKEL